MIFYDGTYRLRGPENKRGPISGWAYCWHLRLINLSLSQPDVKHLKPIIVVAAQTGQGIFKTSCAESLGKRICREFHLDVRWVLWIEQFIDYPEEMYVAGFTPKYYIDQEVFYSVKWRPIRPNELEAIKPFIPEAEMR